MKAGPKKRFYLSDEKSKSFEDTDELAKMAGLTKKEKLAPFFAMNEQALSKLVAGIDDSFQLHAKSRTQEHTDIVLEQLEVLRIISPVNSPEKVATTTTANSPEKTTTANRKLFK